MKQERFFYNILFSVLLLFCTLNIGAQGIPFLRNYTSAEYRAHNRNFDVITGTDGTLYVANFEGLLYYDQSRWRILHTPGITRITSVFRDHKGKIWVGGYNFMGYVGVGRYGELHLVNLLLASNTSLKGEVNWIWEKNGEIQFLTSDNRIYRVHDINIQFMPDGKIPSAGNSTFVTSRHINQIQKITNDLQAQATEGDGVIITDAGGKELFRVTEANGLCSNNVNHITYNGHGILWGATDNGVFALAIPSIYTHFTSSEGLKGEVLCINSLHDAMFVGTLNGLFRRVGNAFVSVPGVRHACWQLEPYGNGLLAATSDGVFLVEKSGAVRKMNNGQGATSVLSIKDGFLSGELDGIYLNGTGRRNRISTIEKATKIFKDHRGNIWVNNLYGQVWLRKKDKKEFTPVTAGNDVRQVCTLVTGLADVVVVNAEGAWMWNGNRLVKQNYDSKFEYPQFSYTDNLGCTWLTNAEGKHLYTVKDGKRLHRYDKLLKSLSQNTVRALYRENHQLWLGGDFGIISANKSHEDHFMNTKAHLRFTSVVLNGDSVIWGGYNKQPLELQSIGSNNASLTFTFALSYSNLLGNSTYRYRINGKQWSGWSTETFAKFSNLSWGSFTLEVQGRDAFGRLSNVVSMDFYVSYPYYLHWYMLLLYLLLVVAAVYGLVKWRMRRLIQDKIRLENMVEERTAVINQQKDELVRQEKMATVGKLTQGLIDRILNPLNYINNFSKLSQGLIKDATANIEDEKENMDEENYEDTIDVFDMLKNNLDKVQEHGQNTTRTLKAMEELLKDHAGKMVDMDLALMMKQCEQITRDFYKQDIAEYGITVNFAYPESIEIIGNQEQLSKTVMSLIANGIYAVKKESGKNNEYKPRIDVEMHLDEDKIVMTIRDNGIGIEEAIQEKIFDPFFTTKTTGEAAGVGLYLSREIAQNHHGDIAVDSKKDQYTQFTIILPQNK